MTVPRQPRRSGALRRYPALGYLAGTAALALLLPSGLTVPNSGPPTLAEYAPVPGQGEGRSDTSDVGLPTSGGLGAGGADEGVGGFPPPPPEEQPGAVGGGGVRKPGTKRCVGNPPRQTEDPLSPPCIAYFEGDNGGATAKGVTADEVVVVMPSDGDKETGPRAGSMVDCADQPDVDDSANDSLCKAYMRFFNERYQTYGRRVHLWSTLALDADVEERLHPFGWIGNPSASKVGSLGIAFAGFPRSVYRAAAPRVIGFRPDLEDVAAIGATFVCGKLAGRPARLSGNSLDRTATRKFGLVMRPGAHRDLLRQALTDRCDVQIDDVVDNPTNDTTSAARMRQNGVTTVIITADNSGDASVMTRQATSIGWFPEWFVPGEPGGRGLDRNSSGRSADQAQWANAFGLTFDVRRGAQADQFWYRAYREGCATCPEPRSADFSTASFEYDMLSLLFHGIQAAGPRLTMANIDKGLHAIPPRASSDPYRPAAYFAPGNFTFVKDATLVRWNGTASAPGSAAVGCYLLPESGRRHRAGEWPAGDTDLSAPGPCQGDTIQ